MASNYKTMTPYVDSFMGENSWKEKHLQPPSPTSTHIPLNNESAAMSTDNMKLGKVGGDPRFDPSVNTANALTASSELDIDSAVKARNASVLDGIDGGFDYYQGGINKAVKHYGDYETAMGKDISGFFEGINPTIDTPIYSLDPVEVVAQAPATQSQPTFSTMGDADNYNSYGDTVRDLSRDAMGIPLSKPTRPNVGSSYRTYGGPDGPTASILGDVDISNVPMGGQETLAFGGQAEPGSGLSGPSGIWGGEVAAEKGIMEKTGDFLKSDTFGTMMAFSPLIGAVSNYQQTQSAIGDLKSAKSQAEGARAGLANAKDAEMVAIADQHSEERRRVGALEKDRIIGNLEKIASTRTGGLVSGEKIEMSEDVVDAAQTRTDVSLAKLQDERSHAEAKIHTANKEERQKLNQTIKELDSKIDEMKKQSITGPLGAIVDVGSNLLMASNPALAIGMQVGKSLLS